MGAVSSDRARRGRMLSAAVALSELLGVTAVGATPPTVHVRGSTRIDATLASGDGGALIVRGDLRDDGQSVLGATALMLRVASARGAPATTLPSARACATTPRDAVRMTSASEVAIETNADGSFCVSLSPAPPAGSVVRVATGATRLHDGTETELSVTAEPMPAARSFLSFDPVTPTIDLDKPEASVEVTLRLERADGARAAGRREGLRIVLEDERGNAVAEAATTGSGHAHLQAMTAKLDGPGPGELHARFEGSDALAGSLAVQRTVRAAAVLLALERVPGAGSPEDGVTLDVTVSSSRGPVDGGVVEASSDGRSIGAGEVTGGRARVTASFASERAGAVPLVLRYVPAAPWWRAGKDLAVEVRVNGPGPWQRLLLLLVVATLALWVARGWRRSAKPRNMSRKIASPRAPAGCAGIQVLEPATAGEGWSGRVVDAHDGRPIAGATLVVLVPSFEGDGVIARSETDERGEFVLVTSRTADARLAVQSELYAAHEQPLPAPSMLVVALVTRRRALLDRLVRWAKRRGEPYDGLPEPTPGHVRRVASRMNAGEVETWAHKVENAAFGPEAVDAAAESQAREGEPGPQHR